MNVSARSNQADQAGRPDRPSGLGESDRSGPSSPTSGADSAAYTAAAAESTDTFVHEPWLSWARMIALVAIVAIHVFGHYVSAWGTVSAAEWHVANLIDGGARFAVPLFVVVSGAALASPARCAAAVRTSAESLGSFYRRRASRIGIPLMVWTAFFLCFDRWMNGEPITAYTFVQGYLWGRPYYHLYFLYVIAGLYLMTPFLRPFLAQVSRRLVWSATLICLALAILNKGQQLWMGGDGGFNAFSYFVPWIGYFLLGHCLAREFAARRDSLVARRRRFALVSALVFATTTATTALLTWLLFPHLDTGTLSVTYDYFSPLTLVATVAITVLVWSSSTPAKPTGSAGRQQGHRERRLANLTFGVFLLHPIPLELMKQQVAGQEFGTPWAGLGYHLALLLGLLLVCGIVTAILVRIPVLRRLVG